MNKKYFICVNEFSPFFKQLFVCENTLGTLEDDITVLNESENEEVKVNMIDLAELTVKEYAELRKLQLIKYFTSIDFFIAGLLGKQHAR